MALSEVGCQPYGHRYRPDISFIGPICDFIIIMYCIPAVLQNST
jgi:hypothetical protein